MEHYWKKIITAIKICQEAGILMMMMIFFKRTIFVIANITKPVKLNKLIEP